MALALVGAWMLLRRSRDRVALIVLIAWGLVSAAGLPFAMVARRSPIIPAVVLAYHFSFLLRGLQWVLCGYGVVALIAVVTSQGSRWLSRPVPIAPVASLAIVALVAVTYRPYLRRDAFTKAVRDAELFGDRRSDAQRAFRWIQEHTPPDAVFLASDGDGLRIVGPAGRRLVCIGEPFSNPYVARAPRAKARDEMTAALGRGDLAAFEGARAPFGVTHVLIRDSRASQGPWQSSLEGAGRRLVFASGDLGILQVSADATVP